MRTLNSIVTLAVAALVGLISATMPAQAQSCAQRKKAIETYAANAHLATMADVANLQAMEREYYARCSGGNSGKAGGSGGTGPRSNASNTSNATAAAAAAGVAAAAVTVGGGRGSNAAAAVVGIGIAGALGGILGEVLSSGAQAEPQLKHSRRKRNPTPE